MNKTDIVLFQGFRKPLEVEQQVLNEMVFRKKIYVYFFHIPGTKIVYVYRVIFYLLQ